MHEIGRIRATLRLMRNISADHVRDEERLLAAPANPRVPVSSTMWGQGNARIRLLDEYVQELERRIDALDDAYTDVVTMHAQEVEGLRRDILTLVGRVYAEDESTYAPETAEVMRRWEPQWHREYQRQGEEVAHGSQA